MSVPIGYIKANVRQVVGHLPHDVPPTWQANQGALDQAQVQRMLHKTLACMFSQIRQCFHCTLCRSIGWRPVDIARLDSKMHCSHSSIRLNSSGKVLQVICLAGAAYQEVVAAMLKSAVTGCWRELLPKLQRQ